MRNTPWLSHMILVAHHPSSLISPCQMLVNGYLTQSQKIPRKSKELAKSLFMKLAVEEKVEIHFYWKKTKLSKRDEVKGEIHNKLN